MEPDRIVEAIGSDTPPSLDDLTAARAELADMLRAAGEGDTPDLAAMRTLAASVEKVDAELAARASQAESDRAEADALLAILDKTEAPDEDASDESAEDKTETPDEEPEPEPAEDPEPEAVAAATLPTSEAIRRWKGARPNQSTETPEPDHVGASFRAVGPASSRGTVASVGEIASIFATFANDSTAKTSLVSAAADHPRRLGRDAIANMATVNAAMQPIVAAGGICPPIPALYDQRVCGDRGRPIRDALPSFGTEFGGRGGVAFPPPLVFGDLASAITVWDEATDADPGSATKACVRIECDTATEITVEAIVACVTIGNFQARFNPEQWAAALNLLMVQHDAAAEANLWTAIRAAGLQAGNPIATVDYEGTARNVFVNLGEAAARYRSSQRLLPSTTLRFLAPSWLRDAIRSSLTRQQPGDQAFQAADATINGWFAAANISPIWSVDIQRLAPQADATWDALTTPAEGSLFVEGSVLFLDGGTLDLGTQITDSVLNSTNDRQAFMETFEQVGVVGCAPKTYTFVVENACVCPAA